MSKRVLSTFTDQITERLREGMAEGRWTDRLPGRAKLAEELGCSPWTIEEAVLRLTKEGILVSPGPGHRRKIVLTKSMTQPRALRVMILLYERQDRNARYMVDLVHSLQDAGHQADFAEKTMRDLKMDPKRIIKLAKNTKADAWVVLSGSLDVLKWFDQQKTPAFAMFGRNTKANLASLSLQKGDALVELTNKLVDLGHKRIVMLAREERRKPRPGYPEQLYLDNLRDRGIMTGSYNLPDWGDSPKEFRNILDSLFKHTPPTALIVSQPMLCVALLQHLSRLNLVAPDDVSVACTDLSDDFEWCDPPITHITWDHLPVNNRIVKWANKISRGKDYRPKHQIKVRIFTGGTIGVAPTDKRLIGR